MRVCILCKNEDVMPARENCKTTLNPNISIGGPIHPIFKKEDKLIDYLSIPTSETGELPATHWFCFMNTNEETYQKMVNNSKYSTIEESGPKEFLEKWNLKIIK